MFNEGEEPEDQMGGGFIIPLLGVSSCLIAFVDNDNCSKVGDVLIERRIARDARL